MSQTELISELGKMRRSLKPILSSKYNKLLEEIENNIKGNSFGDVPAHIDVKPTYNQLLSKLYFKNRQV